MDIKLSVIIPTRNRSYLLNKCLQSLVGQTLSNNLFEVIVVDNASTDDTKAVVESFTDKLKYLNYKYEAKLGLHYGRHLGMKCSKGEVLVFGDDDIIALPTWLEGVLESFRDKNIGLVGGKNLPDYEVSPPSWLEGLWSKNRDGKWLGHYSVLDLGDCVKEISPLFVWGCNFSIRKTILQEIGGFNPDGMPSEKIKFRGDGETAVSCYLDSSDWITLYNPKASVKHLVSAKRMTKEYLKQRVYSQGISDSYSLIRKHGGIYLTDDIKIFIKQVLTGVRDIVQNLRFQLWKSYWSGFHYHRNETAKDPALMNWVLCDSYLNCDEP